MDYLTEAKLLIVGEPGAGKTTLARKILDPNYMLDVEEKSTEGIDVNTWQFPTTVLNALEPRFPRDFRVNVWDFGGQEIYHATHQFFLTRRSVYALVTDERKEDTDFEYWLEIVNLLSGASPLVIVQNQKQGRAHGVDLGTLRHLYPNLVGAVPLNLADPTNPGLAEAVSIIRRELERLPHVGTALPRTWRKVRLALENDPRDHITADEFFSVCSANEFTRTEDMEQLGGYLHDLGICLFFQDDPVLRKTVILKPEWGTDAVYRVLDDPQVAASLGEFNLVDLLRIWSSPAHSSMRHELLQLMVRFALCFQVPGTNTFVAPQLLSPSRPIYDWPEKDDLAISYEYEVMPKGIVRRLIVALHDHIRPGNHVWRNGVVLEYLGTSAEVVEDYRRRALRLRLKGPDPRVLLGIIDQNLSVIHRSFPGLKFETFRPCDCDGCSSASEPTKFSVRDLRDFARTGHGIQCRISRELRDPNLLLRVLQLDERINHQSRFASGQIESAASKPAVFISYKWGGASEELAVEIQRVLSQRGFTVIRDKHELRYKDSVSRFMREIGAGRAVVVILGSEYLKSRNCMFELTEIAARPEFADRIFPVVLDDADIFDAVSRVEYVKHWEQQIKRLKTAMKGVGAENLHGIREDLDLYERIRNTIAGLTDTIANMNTLTPRDHRGTEFDQLYASVEVALMR